MKSISSRSFSTSRSFSIGAVVLGASLAAGIAEARTPLHGLAVAVSAKGDQLVAAGNNRTLYVLDPKSLQVKKRIYLGAAIVEMGFNAKGSVLAASADDGALYLIDTKTWKSTKKMGGHHSAHISVAAGLVASADKDYNAEFIRVTSVDQAKEVHKFKLDKPTKVSALGISPDGGKLAVLLGPIEDKSEKKVSYSDIPKDLKGLKKTEFQLRNDGNTGLVQIYDLKTGKKLSERKTAFSMSGGQPVTIFVRNGVIFNNYSNNGLMLTDAGEETIVQFDGSFLYASRVSHDGKYVVTGSLRSIAIVDASNLEAKAGEPEKLSANKGEIDRIPGWPEYFSGFDATAGGKMFYGGTTGYRVVAIDGDGKVLKSEPVY